MTPISETFAIDINAKLDRELMSLILEKGHSRVPVIMSTLQTLSDLFCEKRQSNHLLTTLPMSPLTEVKVDIEVRKHPQDNALRRKRSLKSKWTKVWIQTPPSKRQSTPNTPEEEEAVGIITMEDVIEELLQVPTYLLLMRRYDLMKRTITMRTHEHLPCLVVIYDFLFGL
ncbi:hypothetical protein GQ457_04G000010 [Hibiscus cannabinus]